MSTRPIVPDDGSDYVSHVSSEKDIAANVPRGLVKDAKLVTAEGNVITKDGIVVSTVQSDRSLSANIFSDPEIKAYYVDVYEKSKYECRHVLDADLTWTQEEEKKLVRRLDWHGMYSKFTTSLLLYSDFALQFACGLVSCSSVFNLIAETWFRRSPGHS